MSDVFLPAALADLFVRSGLLLLLAWAAAAAIGKSGRPGREPASGLAALPRRLASASFARRCPARSSAAGPAGGSRSRPRRRQSALLRPPRRRRPSRSISGSLLAWTIYGLVAAAVAARLLLGHVLLALHWRRADAHPVLESRLDQLKSQLGIARRVHLRAQPRPGDADHLGLSRTPDICFRPMPACWSEERRRLVLLHELAHVSRFDSPVRLAAGLACALYWFQPVVWFAVRKLRIEQEHAADDLVLAAGAGPRLYAIQPARGGGRRARPG